MYTVQPCLRETEGEAFPSTKKEVTQEKRRCDPGLAHHCLCRAVYAQGCVEIMGQVDSGPAPLRKPSPAVEGYRAQVTCMRCDFTSASLAFLPSHQG